MQCFPLRSILTLSHSSCFLFFTFVCFFSTMFSCFCFSSKTASMSSGNFRIPKPRTKKKDELVLMDFHDQKEKVCAVWIRCVSKPKRRRIKFVILPLSGDQVEKSKIFKLRIATPLMIMYACKIKCCQEQLEALKAGGG